MDFEKYFDSPINNGLLLENPIVVTERVVDGIWTPNPKATKERDEKEPQEIKWIRELFDRLFGKEKSEVFIKKITRRSSFDETFERIFPQINLKKRR